MKRREFIKFAAASAIASPLIARAQDRAAPVIGFLGFEAVDPNILAKFKQGLNEWGYFEGKNVRTEYRWEADRSLPLSALAAELVRQRVALIVTTGGSASVKAAREATNTIPILFNPVGMDLVENGLVASLNRPGGNATGFSQSYKELVPKRLEILRQMVPTARRIAYLQNEDTSGLDPSERMQFEADAEKATKLGLVSYYAHNKNEIELAFAAMVRQQTEALLVESDPLFGHRRELITALAAYHALPAGYPRREFVDAGGLMSYGPSITEAWRQLGVYAGRILKGARPQDLPIQLQNKYELVINTKTAETLGLTTPPLLHALADDVIE
jgi:putative ABC transport system substrate-binding protein